jgi:hypothetical protein
MELLGAPRDVADHRLRVDQMDTPKRNLRVTKWLGTVPVTATCTLCEQEFKVSLSAMKQVLEAQESLRRQFTEHECPVRSLKG